MSSKNIMKVDFEVIGKKITIQENLNIDSTGAKVWETSMVLSRFLEKNRRKYDFSKPGQRVIELGAGCGLLGISLTKLGWNILFTDRKEMLELLGLNVMSNCSDVDQQPKIMELDWEFQDFSQFEPPFNAIVGSDVIFLESLVDPLLNTLIHLSDQKTSIFICVEKRNEMAYDLFIEKARGYFSVKKVPTQKLDPEYQTGFSIILILKKLSKS